MGGTIFFLRGRECGRACGRGRIRHGRVPRFVHKDATGTAGVPRMRSRTLHQPCQNRRMYVPASVFCYRQSVSRFPTYGRRNGSPALFPAGPCSGKRCLACRRRRENAATTLASATGEISFTGMFHAITVPSAPHTCRMRRILCVIRDDILLICPWRAAGPHAVFQQVQRMITAYSQRCVFGNPALNPKGSPLPEKRGAFSP